MNQAKQAVTNGIELQIKSVAATVVLVIACKRQIPAIASRVPATSPGFPTAITLDADALP